MNGNRADQCCGGPKTVTDDPQLCAEAARLIDSKFDLHFVPLTSGGQMGFAWQMPDIVAHGDDHEACLRRLKQMLVMEVGLRLREGQHVPTRELSEETVVNVRLSADHKRYLQRLAAASATTLSELVREAVVDLLRRRVPGLAI